AAVFGEHILPVLTPLAVDPGHPFPYISSRSLNLAVQIADPDSRRLHFARVKVPPLLRRFASPEEGVFVPLEDVIAAHLDRLFPGMRIVDHYAFRVTRNNDLEVDDDGAEDLLEALEETIRKRRFSPAVRLEVGEEMPDGILGSTVPGHQPDAVSDLRGETHRGCPRARRRRWQAGRGARRDPGALRRATQHWMGTPPRAGRLSRCVRGCRAQDAREAVPGGSRRGWPHSPLRPCRHGQLQPNNGTPLRGRGSLHRRRAPRCGGE